MTDTRAENGRIGEPLAMGLAWFSIALGVAEVAAPRRLARLIGAQECDRTDAQLRALGTREIGNGIALLAQPHRAAWAWSRVGGDAIDLAWLGSAARSEDADTRRLAGAAAAVVGVTALDVLCARQLGRAANGNGTRAAQRRRTFYVERVTTVNRPVEEVYQFWRNFENFPRFMRHLDAVEILGDRRSRWKAKGPAGLRAAWEAEITEDRPSELIAWRSVEGSWVENSGSVRFKRAPGGRGTEVRVQLDYKPPAGGLGRSVAWLFGEEPDQQVHDDLHRFKQLVETGEIPMSEGPALWRPAQPPADPEELRTLAGVQR